MQLKPRAGLTRFVRAGLLVALALVALGAGVARAQSPSFRWAIRAGGTEDDAGNAIAVDGFGHAYVVGSFGGVIEFPSQGEVVKLTSRGFSDVFLAKVDNLGNLLWVRQAGGSFDDYGRGVAVDAEGCSYITGQYFSTNCVFDAEQLERTGNSDIFIVKYDPTGKQLWVRTAGAVGGISSHALAVDTNGNAFITGQYFGKATWDAGVLTNLGFADIFVAKYDTEGNFVWARNAGGGGDDSGNGIAVDTRGNCFVTGNFSGTARFGPVTTVGAKGHTAIFVAKFDPMGRVLWASSVKDGPGASFGRGIGVDAYGNSYIAGSVNGIMALNADRGQNATRLPRDKSQRRIYVYPSGGSYVAGSKSDAFVAKFNPSGQKVWTRTGGSIRPTVECAHAIAVDAQGNSFVTGTFSGRSNFGGANVVSSGIADVYVAQYDRDGHLIWLRQAGGQSTATHCGFGIALDPAGNSYITGYFHNDTWFGNSLIKSLGEADIFISRLSGSSIPLR